LAHWAAIERISLTLRDLLRRRSVEGIPGTVRVHLVTPASFQQLGTATTATITLFLYQVTENAEMRNQVMRRLPDGRESRQPVPLELCYLITAWAGRSSTQLSIESDEAAAREESRLLGFVVQTLSDHALLTASQLSEADPENPVFGPDDSVQIIFDPLSIEDHYRIWDASELGYRLSLTYRVRVVRIDSAVFLEPARVTEATLA